MFRFLAADASPADPAGASDGTWWAGRQLLVRMLVGYLVRCAVLVLAGCSRGGRPHGMATGQESGLVGRPAGRSAAM